MGEELQGLASRENDSDSEHEEEASLEDSPVEVCRGPESQEWERPRTCT